jgi:hypothetical protein
MEKKRREVLEVEGELKALEVVEAQSKQLPRPSP